MPTPQPPPPTQAELKDLIVAADNGAVLDVLRQVGGGGPDQGVARWQAWAGSVLQALQGRPSRPGPAPGRPAPPLPQYYLHQAPTSPSKSFRASTFLQQ